jgi:hypothetical protein
MSTLHPAMSAFLFQEQVNLGTGELLDSSRQAGWADCLAALYAHPHTSKGDESESESESDSDLETVDKLFDYSHLDPQMEAESLEWKDTFEQCTQDIKSLASACLRDAGHHPEELLMLNKRCASMLQFLTRVCKAIWCQPSWKAQLRATDFPSVSFALQNIHIDPHFDIPDGLLSLWRQCQIADSLSLLLWIWFEDDVSSYQASSQQTPDEPSHLPDVDAGEGDHFNSSIHGQTLVEILMNYPTMIPLRTHPSCIYFLSSPANFGEAYAGWLRAALTLHGVKASCFLS